MPVRTVSLVSESPASEDGPASSREATCPICKGLPQHMRDVLGEDAEVVKVLVLCEVCEQTGMVSRRLARELWWHQEPSA